MGRRTLLFLGAILAVFAAAAGVFVIRHDWLVEELMERVHEGNESPWAVVKVQAGAETPDWERLRDAAIEFVEMARALEAAKHAGIRASADGYATAAAGLSDSVARADAGRFRESAAALGASCGDCHFDGGVGGTLRGD